MSVGRRARGCGIYPLGVRISDISIRSTYYMFGRMYDRSFFIHVHSCIVTLSNPRTLYQKHGGHQA